MNGFVGGLLALWGIFILFSALVQQKAGYNDDGQIGASGFLEFEFLSKLLFNKMSSGAAKSIIIVIGISFIALGTIIILY